MFNSPFFQIQFYCVNRIQDYSRLFQSDIARQFFSGSSDSSNSSSSNFLDAILSFQIKISGFKSLLPLFLSHFASFDAWFPKLECEKSHRLNSSHRTLRNIFLETGIRIRSQVAGKKEKKYIKKIKLLLISRSKNIYIYISRTWSMEDRRSWRRHLFEVNAWFIPRCETLLAWLNSIPFTPFTWNCNRAERDGNKEGGRVAVERKEDDGGWGSGGRDRGVSFRSEGFSKV